MLLNILKPTHLHSVAILATGDEIVNGDTLNTNTQHIAQLLSEKNILVGAHMACSDSQNDIKKGLVFLLKSHQAVIMTGGLGPTSDDRTRFALSAAINKPLSFDQASWQHVKDYIAKFSNRTPPDSNQQQALFPKNADIYDNPNGTACGCGLQIQGKWIFMLPGPPGECLPMFENFVLPCLIKEKFPNHMLHKKWLTFNVSEGQLATELDSLVDGLDVVTGYRLSYPYLEVKLHGNNDEHFAKASHIIEQAIKPMIIGDGNQCISQSLQDYLATANHSLTIIDKATGGVLQNSLLNPQTQDKLSFCDTDMADVICYIRGLDAYWQGQHSKETTFELSISGKIEQTINETIPYRGQRSLLFASEKICQHLLQVLKK